MNVQPSEAATSFSGLSFSSFFLDQVWNHSNSLSFKTAVQHQSTKIVSYLVYHDSRQTSFRMGHESLNFWRKRRKEQENTSSALAPLAIPLRSSSAPDTAPTSVPHDATNIAQVSGVSSQVSNPPNVSSSTPDATNAPPASALGDVSNASDATISNSMGTLSQPQVLPHSSSHPSPGPSRLSGPSSGNRQERLWDRAYREVQAQEPEIIEAYEYLLSTIDSPSNNETRDKVTYSTKERYEQMRRVAEAGLKKTERSTAVQQKINDGMQVISPLRDVIDQVVKVSEPAGMAWVGVSFVVEILANPFTEPGINRTGMIHVLSKMQWYMDLADPQLDEKSSKLQTKLWLQLEVHTVELYKALLLYQMKSTCCFYKSGLKTILRNVVKLDDWNRQLDDIKTAEDTVSADLKAFQDQVVVDHLKDQADRASQQYDAIQTCASLIHLQIQKREEEDQKQKDKECIRHLRLTDPTFDKDRILAAKGHILQEAYQWIFDHPEYRRWQSGSQSRRLWIKGDPGKGKTMLLCGVIQELEKDPFKRLCYFFCQATEDKLSNARSVLRGLIYHLVKQYPRLIQHARKEYDTSGERLFDDHNAWEVMCRVFESILGDDHLDEVLIMIDALDECMVDCPKLLEFISKISSSSRAKLIVTSRNWPDIEKTLGDDTEHASILPLELNDDLISDAVGKYISWKLRTLKRTIPYKNDQEICDRVRHHLLENSNNTFLWAALVCQELSSGKVTHKRHVQLVLDKAPTGLDQLYERMFEGISEVAPFDADLCRDILAVTSVLKRPVTLEELLTILDPIFVSDLGPEALEIRKKEFTAYSSIEHRHSAVFRRALDTLSDSTVLRRDIYDIQEPGVHIKYVVPPKPDLLVPLQYGCSYWVDHLGDSTLAAEDISRILKFLSTKLLYWVEAHILLGHISKAIISLQRLGKLVNPQASEEAKVLAQLVQDANRFILYGRITTEVHPLQLYASSLVFSPRSSIVRKLFQDDIPTWITSLPNVSQVWSPCLQILEGHEDFVLSVAFSPDGQWLASAAGDGDIRLWDPATCICVHTLKHPVSQVPPGNEDSLVFSRDIKRLFAGLANNAVAVWSPDTGTCLGILGKQPDEHFGSRTATGSVAYSFTQHRIATADQKGLVTVFDADSGTEMHVLELGPQLWPELTLKSLQMAD
ncbi:nwd1 protein [Colletotrichum sojae]|uniref:Nwd1 protein n=1 Tax=Colletotrichum sojae TaxID=2175907 RepID=A0A8H6MMY6_9PEZI|nr:nwd1 protein [Colletotrichum sojae]